MNLFKALIPGTILTLVVCGILGSARSKGGFLNVFHQNIEGISLYWSWPMFAVGTIMCWALFAMTPK